MGHSGAYGHEFLEFEFRPDGRLRYANNSNYKRDVLIRKEGRKKEKTLFLFNYIYLSFFLDQDSKPKDKMNFTHL